MATNSQDVLSTYQEEQKKVDPFRQKLLNGLSKQNSLILCSNVFGKTWIKHTR